MPVVFRFQSCIRISLARDSSYLVPIYRTQTTPHSLRLLGVYLWRYRMVRHEAGVRLVLRQPLPRLADGDC